ncbi:Transposon Tf2-6 polyprotein [Labeo rohita]|uniref:ribonuclease H n=1 Tax=Labeo rohita TaxID=84645 RepID=A0ABQ8MIY1_LABRO|nr:Transposon Tf2-6 polyprotein [Labeo rohita]
MELPPTAAASPEPAPPVPEPMIMENYHLSRAERARRVANSLCLYCSSQDHLLRPAVTRKTIYQITNIQGKPLGKGLVRNRTPELVLDIGCLYSERIPLLVLEEANVDIVLGRPWLTRHDPLIDWRSGEICKWSPRCYQECLKELPKPVIATTHLPICSTSVESHNSSQTLSIPPEYQVFQDVFSKVAATHLSPHRPWDCAIDLLPGGKLPKGRVYPLSILERATMEEYIQEALQQGFIRPSTSPAASSFFFIAKKDGALNEQTVKFAYPLPLVPAALEELRGARIFSKLDLRSAYNLIRIRRGDEWKTAFITPTGHYEYRVMPYGLSNSPIIATMSPRYSSVSGNTTST